MGRIAAPGDALDQRVAQQCHNVGQQFVLGLLVGPALHLAEHAGLLVQDERHPWVPVSSIVLLSRLQEPPTGIHRNPIGEHGFIGAVGCGIPAVSHGIALTRTGRPVQVEPCRSVRELLDDLKVFGICIAGDVNRLIPIGHPLGLNGMEGVDQFKRSLVVPDDLIDLGQIQG